MSNYHFYYSDGRRGASLFEKKKFYSTVSGDVAMHSYVNKTSATKVMFTGTAALEFGKSWGAAKAAGDTFFCKILMHHRLLYLMW